MYILKYTKSIMANTSPKQWCPKISVEEFNRQGKENTEREVKKLLEQLNKDKKNKSRNLPGDESNISAHISDNASSDNSDENQTNTVSHHSSDMDNSLDKNIIMKIMNQNNSLKDKLHKSQIKHIDLKNSLTKLETLEYNQRLELGNKNIKIEEITDNLRSKTKELERFHINKVSINNKLKKYERMNKLYILLCMLLSLIVFSSQIYIRYFTKYRPTIMTWLFTSTDDYCLE